MEILKVGDGRNYSCVYMCKYRHNEMEISFQEGFKKVYHKYERKNQFLPAFI